MQRPVETGVELLATLESELSVKEAIDRIELISADPAVQREILDTADRRGVIRRDNGRIASQSSRSVSFQRDVVSRAGDFDCKRCHAGLSTGYFIQLDTAELGPFGSSCIRKVTGRD